MWSSLTSRSLIESQIAGLTPSCLFMCAPPSKIDGKYLAPVDNFALATHINDNQSKSECYTVWKPNGLVIAVVFVIVEIIGKSRVVNKAALVVVHIGIGFRNDAGYDPKCCEVRQLISCFYTKDFRHGSDPVLGLKT